MVRGRDQVEEREVDETVEVGEREDDETVEVGEREDNETVEVGEKEDDETVEVGEKEEDERVEAGEREDDERLEAEEKEDDGGGRQGRRSMMKGWRQEKTDGKEKINLGRMREKLIIAWMYCTVHCKGNQEQIDFHIADL